MLNQQQLRGSAKINNLRASIVLAFFIFIFISNYALAQETPISVDSESLNSGALQPSSVDLNIDNSEDTLIVERDKVTGSTNKSESKKEVADPTAESSLTTTSLTAGAVVGEGDTAQSYSADLGHLGNIDIQSNIGSLQYSYDLITPPSRGFVVPNLKLQYSQNSNTASYFGYGWELSIPYIERISKNGSNLLYATSSQYFSSTLDGELSLISGTNNKYGAAIELGDFLDYELINNTWVVTDKVGTKFIFGTTTQARQDNPLNNSQVYRWYLERVEDKNGNLASYLYTKHGGAIYPQKISYGGTLTTDHIFDVIFNLSNSATTTSYRPAFKVENASLVSSVSIEIDGQLSRGYDFRYATGTNGQRSLLAGITEFGYEGGQTNSMPEEVFEYSGDQVPTWTENDSVDFPEPLNDKDLGVRFADMNGDGLMDIVRYYKFFDTDGTYYDVNIQRVHINKGDGSWDINVPWNWSDINKPFMYKFDAGSTNKYEDLGSRLVDVNGDGRADLVLGFQCVDQCSYADMMHRTQIGVYINNGTGFVKDNTWSNVPTFVTWNQDHHFLRNEARDLIDVNGDGLPDVVTSYFNSSTNGSPQANTFSSIMLNTGNGWVPSSLSFPAALGPQEYSTPAKRNFEDVGTRVADVNGDGLVDVLRGFRQDASLSNPNPNRDEKNVYINTGNGWATSSIYTLPREFIIPDYPKINEGYDIADLNGDGLPEIVRAYYDSANNNYYYEYYLNTGSGWTSKTYSSPYYTTFGYRGYSSGKAFIDFDGDTVVDTWDLYYGDDINGTQVSSGKVYINNADIPDLLVKVKKVAGGEIEIGYDGFLDTVQQSYALVGTTTYNPVVVSSVSYDPIIGTDWAENYTYERGFYSFSTTSPKDRKFAGFETINKISADTKIVSRYHQGDKDNLAFNESGDSYTKIGLPYREDVYDLDNKLFQTSQSKWLTENNATNTGYVYKSKQLIRAFDGDSDTKDSATEYVFNTDNGNLLSQIEWGEVSGSSDGGFSDIGTDKRVSFYTYATSTDGYVTRHLSSEKTEDLFGNKVKESLYYYDNQSLGLLSKGNLTKREDWVSLNNYVNKQSSYNSFGLKNQDIDSNGNVTNYTYDLYNLYVATTTNPLAQSTTFTYDYSSGRLKRQVDPNGFVSEVVYDTLDRPIEVKETPYDVGELISIEQITYTDTPGQFSTKNTKSIDSSLDFDIYNYLDGFGRLIQKRQTAENVGEYVVLDTEYGDNGLIKRKSLPYFSQGSENTNPTSEINLYSNYTYDALNREKSISNAVGANNYNYDQWIQTVTDAAGNDKDYKYDAFGRLIGVVEYNGVNPYETTYGWDVANNLISITDAEGNVRNIAYDGLGRRIELEDLHNESDDTFGVWLFSYDNNGNIVSSTNPNGQIIDYTYDSLNRPEIENYLGSSQNDVVYSYDACVYGTSRLCLVGNNVSSTTYAYTPKGLVATETKTVSGDSYITEYDYDLSGNKKLVIYPDGSEVKYLYNRAGKIEKIEQREFEDSFRDIVKDFDYGPHGFFIYQKNANNSETFKTYDEDALYRLQSIVTVATTTFGTGGLGTDLSDIEPEFLIAEPGEILVGEMALDYVIDDSEGENGPEIIVEDNNPDLASGAEEQIVQPELTIEIELAEIEIASGSLDNDGNNKKLEIESLDKKIKKPFATSSADFVESELVTESTEQTSLASNEMRSLSQVSALSAGSLTKTVIIQPGPEGKDTHYGTVYRTGGMPNEPFLSIGGWGDWYYTFVEFDLSGLPIADNVVSAQLNLYSMVSPTSLSNDGTLDRVTQSWTESGLTNANNPTFTSTGIPWSFVPTGNWWNNDVTTIVKNWLNNVYPNYGLRVRARYNNGNKGRSFYSSDEMTATSSRPKLTLVVVINPPSSPSGLTVDNQTNPVGIENNTPDFSAVFEDIDGANEVATHYQVQVDNDSDFSSVYWDSTKTVMSSTSEGSRIPDITYSGPVLASSTDYYWRIKLWDQDNLEGDWSTSTSYFSLATGTASSTNGTTTPPAQPVPGDLVQSISYTYDAVGNITQIIDNSNTISKSNTVYEYDDLYRLVLASTTLASTSPYKHVYAYSPVGNITNSSLGAYEYEDLGHNNPHAVTSIAGVEYSYDNNGNLASTSAGAAYLWDYKNRMTQSSIGGNTTSYDYDYNGDRVFKTTSEGTTFYPFTHYEITDTGTTTKYVYAGDQLVATIELATPAPRIDYVYSDHLGSTDVVLGDDGYLTQVIDYHPFGDVRIDEQYNDYTQDRKYIGQEYDEESQMSYLNARYYDGTRGKFISQDPVFWEIGQTKDGVAVLKNPQTQNSYSYAQNNPIVYKDPEGRIALGFGFNGSGSLPGMYGDASTYAVVTMSSSPLNIEVGLISSGGGGLTTGLASLDGSVGLLLSNARSISDLEGPDAVIGGSVKMGAAVGVDVSTSKNNANRQIVTFNTTVGLGGVATPYIIPAELHGGAGYSKSFGQMNITNSLMNGAGSFKSNIQTQLSNMANQLRQIQKAVNDLKDKNEKKK